MLVRMNCTHKEQKAWAAAVSPELKSAVETSTEKNKEGAQKSAE